MKTVFCLAAALLACASTSSASATQGPKEALEDFYKSYLAYIDSTFTKSPKGYTLKQANTNERKAIDRFFTRRYLSEITARNKKCAQTREPTNECDGNFFYCAQEAPTGFEVREAEVTGATAKADVVLCFNCKLPQEEKRIAKASLRLQGKAWKIDSIHCPD